MPTSNRVVYHEGKHETDVTAECTKTRAVFRLVWPFDGIVQN